MKNINEFTTKEYIQDHALAILRPARPVSDGIVSRPFKDGIEECVFIPVPNEHCGYKLPVVLAEKLGIDIEGLFESARINSFADIVVRPINEIIGGEAGSFPIMVVTNESAVYGAINGFLVAEAICRKYNWPAAWIIPSSIHETLIIPEGIDREVLDSTIRDINTRIVDERDRLSDRAYKVEITA